MIKSRKSKNTKSKTKSKYGPYNRSYTRLNRAMKSNDLRARIEANCYIYGVQGANQLGFTFSSQTYMRISELLQSSQTWTDMSSKYVRFRIDSMEFNIYETWSHAALDSIYGTESGIGIEGAPIIHLMFFQNAAADAGNLGHLVLRNDKTKVMTPYSNHFRYVCPLLKETGRMNSPYLNWLATGDVSLVTGQLQMYDGNDSVIKVHCRPYFVKTYIYCTFRDLVA